MAIDTEHVVETGNMYDTWTVITLQVGRFGTWQPGNYAVNNLTALVETEGNVYCGIDGKTNAYCVSDDVAFLLAWQVFW